MGDNVHRLNGAAVGDETKQRFLDWMAGGYDKFVEAHGETPDYMAFALGRLKGHQACGWTGQDEAEGASEAFVSRAILGLQRQLLEY